ncbi:hypothetical protein FNJ84_20735 [Paracoccus sp. M683]|uniref:hypothetical protein n=1 Tax=Paracoccus sp. M683 TaxID=2594268 RepID=UPI00118025EF|nr:hypothetical protein [Paracoccus sp. M683]TRW92929.1 hypothetical protein FNJ84_20735 [Paracoccus sp. M683]
MKEVILHVGFAKTASTGIQSTLACNRDTLAKSGISYARFSLEGKEITNHSLALTYLFTERGKTHHVNAKLRLDETRERARAQAELEHALENSAERLVISSETVPFFTKAELENIRDFFAVRGIRLRLIGLVRPTLAFLSSLSQQFVKTGMPLRVSSQKSPMKLCAHLTKTFPDVELYSFRDACAHESGPVGFFLDKIGAELPGLDVDVVSNAAWSDNAIRLCSYLNTHAPVGSAGVLNPLRENRDIIGFSLIGGPRFALTKNELDIASLEHEIEWLVERYGEGFFEDLSGFATEPAEWQQQQIRQAANIAQNIPLHLVPLIHSYFTTTARLGQGVGIKPIAEMAKKRFFGAYSIAKHD